MPFGNDPKKPPPPPPGKVTPPKGPGKIKPDDGGDQPPQTQSRSAAGYTKALN
jgi:hypothetical protein